MKLIHLSDLHLGKRVNGFSMIEDQQYILTRILEIIKEEDADGVLIAGDVYDKTVPSAEAVQLFDDFLVRLSEEKRSVLIISGNHDSPERLSFGAQLMTASGVYLSPVYDGAVKPITFEDAFGSVHVFLLPFLKPAHARAVFPDKEINSYTDAVSAAIQQMDIDPQERNILVTHQFVTGAQSCDSEALSAGGTDHIEAGVFRPFDYVALGHLHSPQNIPIPPQEGKSKRQTRARYCGTPLKYSFSEVKHQKSVTVIELKEKGNLLLRTVPLIPRRQMREIRGSYMEVTAREQYQFADQSDYVHITLTDEEDIFDAIGKLRSIYPNLMKLDYDNSRVRAQGLETAAAAETKPPARLFADFFQMQNGQELSPSQESLVEKLVKAIWEDEK